jgi:hypothetical protein
VFARRVKDENLVNSMTRRANAQVDEPANLAEEKRLAVLESFRNVDAWLAFGTARCT